VPEIHAGTVEMKAIAREAGSRSKVAVASRQEGLDPVGATVGQRGGRVQAVVAELGGEKIDVIPWADDPAVFVANALSPAQVVGVTIDEDARIASVTVPERMLSLAIGREGQNARLAAKLTGWRIDIRSDQAPARESDSPGPEARPAEAPSEPLAVDVQAPVAVEAVAEPVAVAADPVPSGTLAADEPVAAVPATVGEAPAPKPKRARKAVSAAAVTPAAEVTSPVEDAAPAAQAAAPAPPAAAAATEAAPPTPKPAASRKRTRQPAEATEVSS
jgi:N utilization substance protein A